MKKILHVITSLEIGGAEKLMVDLLPRLKSAEYDVELLVFNGVRTIFTEQIETNGIKIISLSKSRNVYNSVNIIKLIPIIRKYDIIHTHNTACQLFVPIAKILSFSKVKLVTTEHSTNNRRRGNKLLRLVDKWMYDKYNYIICVSDIVKVDLNNHLRNKRMKDKITAIPNGIDCSLFINAQPLSLKNNTDVVILMVARFAYPKDQETVIQSMAFLPTNVSLFFVGEGEEMKRSVELANAMGISDRVHFLGLRTDIPQLMKSADIIILSSHYEGLSLSSLEAMSSGRPFVASDVPGLREIVKDAGVLFKDEDHKALADIIIKLLNNKDYYSQIANKCVNKAKQFDISITANKYLNIYNSL